MFFYLLAVLLGSQWIYFRRASEVDSQQSTSAKDPVKEKRRIRLNFSLEKQKRNEYRRARATQVSTSDNQAGQRPFPDYRGKNLVPFHLHYVTCDLSCRYVTNTGLLH